MARDRNTDVTTKINRLSTIAFGLCLVLVILLSACDDDIEQEADQEPQPQQEITEAEQQRPQEDASRPSQAGAEADQQQSAEPATAAAESSDAVAELAVSIDEHTTWQEVFDQLGAAEQSCIREALADQSLDSILATPLASGTLTEQWEAAIFSCLAPETARAILLSALVASLGADLGLALTEDDQSCLRDWVSEIDVAEVVAASADAEEAGIEGPPAEVFGMFECLPQMWIGAFLGAGEVEISEAEASCLREWSAGVDWAAFYVGVENDDASVMGQFMPGFTNCLPDLFVSLIFAEAGIEIEDVSEAEASCLRERSAELDWGAFFVGAENDDASALAEFMPVLTNCLPDQLVSLILVPAGIDLEDASEAEATCLREWAVGIDWAVLFAAGVDHAGVPPEIVPGLIRCLPAFATPVQIGATADGLIEDNEGVFFSFEAEADRMYQIDVQLGSLEDSVATLYDPEAHYLAFNDDHGTTLGSRIYLRADTPGRHYVAVSAAYGWDGGSFSLSVTVLDETDDHADSIEGATPVAIGEEASGALNVPDDVDYFAFEFEEGKLYRIDVAVDTLYGSAVALLDSEAEHLAHSDQFAGEDSTGFLIYWRAAASGPHYVAVSALDGWGTGSYSVSAALLDVTDDHADSVEGATRLALDQVAGGALDYPGDIDYFAFELEQGRVYRIDVALDSLYTSQADLYDATGQHLTFSDYSEETSAPRIYWTAETSGRHYVAVSAWGSDTGSYTVSATVLDLTDDHANSVEGATPAVVGEPVPGAIDYPRDDDYFAFEFEEGRVYRIEVEPGTLSDPEATLYNAEAEHLAYTEQHEDTTAMRVYWQAETSGRHFVEVSAWSEGSGSYSMSVTLVDEDDDHADSIEGATRAAVGEDVSGTIDYAYDLDVFAFEFEEGRVYQIDVQLGTLSDSRAALVDADGELLWFNDDYGETYASRIYWKAETSGRHYVEVASWGESTGSYSVSATLFDLDLADDHADWIQDATRATVGEDIPGAVDSPGDLDIFAFELEAGQTYRIEVALDGLSDSVARLYDSEGQLLEENDDYDETESRIYWQAETSGRHFVEVFGYADSVGSYTLSVVEQ